MSEPTQKCKNSAIFKQTYTQKLFIGFKMAFPCFFRNQDFRDFFQKGFILVVMGVHC